MGSGFRSSAISSSSTMLETVCELSAVSRAIVARDSAPLVLMASITTRRLCDLACSRLVPAMVFLWLMPIDYTNAGHLANTHKESSTGQSILPPVVWIQEIGAVAIQQCPLKVKL